MPSSRNGSRRQTRIVSHISTALILTAAVFSISGCAQFNNPWKDSGAHVDADLTTPSSEGFRGQGEFGGTFRRDYDESVRVFPRGVVTHWPLWFEDPFEDKGNECRAKEDLSKPDDRFAWNWMDYLHIGYGPARYVLNTVAWPVSAVVTPPGLMQESDGRVSDGLLGPDHDACRSDIEKRDPPDVVSDCQAGA